MIKRLIIILMSCMILSLVLVQAQSDRLIERDINNLKYIGSKLDQACLIIDWDHCFLDIADYDHPDFNDFDIGVETQAYGISGIEAIESIFDGLERHSYSGIEKKTWKDNDYYIAYKDQTHIAIVWHSGKNIILIGNEDWDGSDKYIRVLGSLLDAYFKKYPSSLNFHPSECFSKNMCWLYEDDFLEIGNSNKLYRISIESMSEKEIISDLGLNINISNVKLNINGHITPNLYPIKLEPGNISEDISDVGEFREDEEGKYYKSDKYISERSILYPGAYKYENLILKIDGSAYSDEYESYVGKNKVRFSYFIDDNTNCTDGFKQLGCKIKEGGVVNFPIYLILSKEGTMDDYKISVVEIKDGKIKLKINSIETPFLGVEETYSYNNDESFVTILNVVEEVNNSFVYFHIHSNVDYNKYTNYARYEPEKFFGKFFGVSNYFKKIQNNNTLCLECLYDNACYGEGTRDHKEFCSGSGNFLKQKDIGKGCNVNHECKSYVCFSGECIKRSFMHNLLVWFKRLFGIK